MQAYTSRLTQVAKCHPWSTALGSLAAVVALSSCSSPISRALHFRAKHEPIECIVLITGCDSGMGKSMSDVLVARGYLVIAVCLTKDGAGRLSPAENLTVLVGDVTKDADVKKIGDTIGQMISSSKKDLKLWAVVNNAGVAPCGFTDWLDMDTIKQVMDVNYFGVVAVSKVCLPYMKKTRGSRIINISSLAGLTSGAHLGAYSASKHALEGWTKAFRAEVAPFGISVSNVNSGFLKTPLINSSLEQALRLYRKTKDHHDLYSEDMCHYMADRVRSVNESPSCVINLVCDFLICKSNPPLRNYAGWQAFGMRWGLMLPQSLIDAAGNVMTPLTGVNTALIKEMQQ